MRLLQCQWINLEKNSKHGFSAAQGRFQWPNVASGYHTGHCRYRTLPWSQKVLSQDWGRYLILSELSHSVATRKWGYGLGESFFILRLLFQILYIIKTQWLFLYYTLSTLRIHIFIKYFFFKRKTTKCICSHFCPNCSFAREQLGFIYWRSWHRRFSRSGVGRLWPWSPQPVVWIRAH